MHVVASGHGADDANALSDLLATLRERNESADAIAYVSDEYAALAGKALRVHSLEGGSPAVTHSEREVRLRQGSDG